MSLRRQTWLKLHGSRTSLAFLCFAEGACCELMQLITELKETVHDEFVTCELTVLKYRNMGQLHVTAQSGPISEKCRHDQFSRLNHITVSHQTFIRSVFLQDLSFGRLLTSSQVFVYPVMVLRSFRCA